MQVGYVGDMIVACTHFVVLLGQANIDKWGLGWFCVIWLFLCIQDIGLLSQFCTGRWHYKRFHQLTRGPIWGLISGQVLAGVHEVTCWLSLHMTELVILSRADLYFSGPSLWWEWDLWNFRGARTPTSCQGLVVGVSSWIF